jgi:Flp pilus assembly protein TadD
MTNSDNGALVAWEIVRSVATEYGWTKLPEKRSLARRLALIIQIKGADVALKAYVLAKADPDQAKQIDASVLDMVGTIAWSSGRREEGLKVFERNAHEYADSAEPLAGLGEAYAELHRTESARTAFNAALKIDPANRAALEGLKNLDALPEK